MGLGVGLFLSTSSLLLDAYQASESYQRKVTPIINELIRDNQSKQLTEDERFDLQMNLPRSQINKDNFESLRMRFYGGIALFVFGSLVMTIYEKKRAIKDA